MSLFVADEFHRGAYDFHLRVRFQNGHSLCDELRSEEIVGIHGQDINAVRCRHCAVSGTTRPGVFLVQQFHTRISRGNFRHNSGRSVRRSVVYHDHFDLMVGRCQNTVQGVAHKLLHII